MKKKIFIISGIFLLAVVAVLAVVFITRDDKTSDISIDINDTLPDGNGKKATVILLGGQSNASGCSFDEYLKKNVSKEKYAEYESGFDNVYINYHVTDSNVSGGFVKCAVRQGELGERFGPELGLAEKLHEHYPEKTFFIIKCAWGGSNLFRQWRSPSSMGKTGEMYAYFDAFVKTSLQYLDSKNYDVEIAGMCWMQGESDSVSKESAKDYAKNLKKFIKDVRKSFEEYAPGGGIAFVDAYIADNPSLWTYCDVVNEKKREVAELSSINTVVDTGSLVCSEEPENEPDIPHYDSMSEIKLGHLFAEQIMKFIG